MAVFKCKMCGGNLEVQKGESVCTCTYCGSTMTLPKLDDEKRANLYDRANHYRRNNEFDKAIDLFEKILNEDMTDAEAYWSLVLCKYGIEYVEDPKSHKRIPTCNRTLFTSIFSDEDYKKALEYADSSAKGLYEEEARVIDGIQKGILEISSKEEPFDIFICYKETDSSGRRTPDSVLAQEIYFQLTHEGYKVFFSRITLESVLGTAYEPYIFAALNSAKVMLVVGTKPEYFKSPWVKNEWSRFLGLIKSGLKKTLIPTYKDMDPYDLPEEFSHLQSQDMSKLGFISDLIRGIKKILVQNDSNNIRFEARQVNNIQSSNIDSLIKRAFILIEDEEWIQSNNLLEQILNINPEIGLAYLGKLLVKYKFKTIEDLRNLSVRIDNDNYFQRSVKYLDENTKTVLENISNYLSIKESKNIEIAKLKAIMNSIIKSTSSQEVDNIIAEIKGFDSNYRFNNIISKLVELKQNLFVDKLQSLISKNGFYVKTNLSFDQNLDIYIDKIKSLINIDEIIMKDQNYQFKDLFFESIDTESFRLIYDKERNKHIESEKLKLRTRMKLKLFGVIVSSVLIISIVLSQTLLKPYFIGLESEAIQRQQKLISDWNGKYKAENYDPNILYIEIDITKPEIIITRNGAWYTDKKNRVDDPIPCTINSKGNILTCSEKGKSYIWTFELKRKGLIFFDGLSGESGNYLKQ